MIKCLEYIDAYKDEMVKSLQELLAFESVVHEEEGGTPFGVEVQKAFYYMLDMAKRDGFITVNTDNRAGHIEMGEGDDIVGVLVHLDTVPAGDNWNYDPHGNDIADGNLYGRGTIDNKGPAIMAYYAMKAISKAAQDDPRCGLKSRVRLILGLDEEKGAWDSISYYFQKQEAPHIGFTPDSQFPVVHAEMGILIFELVKKINKTRGVDKKKLKSIKGGNAHNMVPDSCIAVVSGEHEYTDIKTSAAKFAEKTGYKISCRTRGKALEITTEGVSAHGSVPQQGLNAISVMMAFLAEVDLQGDEINDFIRFYNDKIGFDLHGEHIGCGLSDEISGKLIFNVGVINVNGETATLTVCVRYPVTEEGGHVYDSMREAVDHYDLGIVKIEDKKPVYFPLESTLVTTLTDIYKKHTGDVSAIPIVSGGGTYARAAENIIAFGPSYAGEKREHKKDEYIEIDRLVKTAKIYAEAIYKLANAGEDIYGVHTICSEEETENFGRKLAGQIRPGDIICLSGELGAGKTTLAKSIIKALDVEDTVTSPTFTIMQMYQGRIPIYHFDAYRIDDPEEMHEIGFEEYLYGDGVCIVEWAEKIEEIFPQNALHITIEYGDRPEEPESRTIIVANISTKNRE